MFTSLINNVRARAAKHNRYRRMADEIMSMTDRDLADINGNRTDMLHHAYKEVYG